MENREDYKTEAISSFAFKTGKLIENLIIEETSNLKHTNQMLEAMILSFYAKLDKWDHLEDGGFVKSEFEKHFNINCDREGSVNA